MQFCGGSASVPRGVVYPPVSLSGGGEVLNCSDLNGISVIVDDHGPPSHNLCRAATQTVRFHY